MQSYASLHSPSLRKMNGQDHSSRGRPFNHKARFDFGNVIGDPFALATVSIGLVSRSLDLPFVASRVGEDVEGCGCLLLGGDAACDMPALTFPSSFSAVESKHEERPC